MHISSLQEDVAMPTIDYQNLLRLLTSSAEFASISRALRMWVHSERSLTADRL